MPFPSDTCSWVERQGSIFFQEWTKKAQLCGLRKMAFSAELGVVLNHCRHAMAQAGGGKDLSLDGFTCELSGEAVATLPSGYTDFERRLHACDVLEQVRKL